MSSRATMPATWRRSGESSERSPGRVRAPCSRSTARSFACTGGSASSSTSAPSGGNRFIDSLSGDIRLAYPGIRGFSVCNLKYMLRLASESTSNLCSRLLHKFAERPLRSTSAPIGVSEFRTTTSSPRRCAESCRRRRTSQAASDEATSRAILTSRQNGGKR